MWQGETHTSHAPTRPFSSTVPTSRSYGREGTRSPWKHGLRIRFRPYDPYDWGRLMLDITFRVERVERYRDYEDMPWEPALYNSVYADHSDHCVRCPQCAAEAP